MPDSFWIFLIVAVFMGILLPIIVIVTKHQQTMKQLEIEALKIKKADSQSEDVEVIK